MDYRLAQIILAARGDDIEGWMNTLVVVLLMVFWAVGGILRARARKTGAEEEDEEEGKPRARGATAKPMYKARGVAVRRPPQLRRIGEPSSVSVRKAQGPEAVAKITDEQRVRQARHERPKKPKPKEPAIEPLLSADKPDELRRAILHYEILGKPLALREPIN